MAGYPIPMPNQTGSVKKRKIGRFFSETNLLNILAFRANGNLADAVSGGETSEIGIAFPKEWEFYLAGTFTDSISYFFDMAYEGRVIEGTAAGVFEERSEFALGKEFFLMFDLPGLWSGQGKKTMAHTGGMGMMRMGPMLMVGKIDPSTNFSYPTNRQLILNAPGKVKSGVMARLSLTPYAFAAKFFGIRGANGKPLEVTKEALYNTQGSFGADLHAMLGPLMLQTGIMQGLESDATDSNQQKDPYLMVRLNFGGEDYLSGSFSGLIYWGLDTAQVPETANSKVLSPVDWLRYGFSANLKYKLLDIYGAVLWDKIENLPEAARAVFDDEAFGITLQADYLATQKIMLSARYDQLNAGGFLSQKANGRVVTLQVRYYSQDNVSFYLRDSYNVAYVSANPLQNYRNLIALGVDLDF